MSGTNGAATAGRLPTDYAEILRSHGLRATAGRRASLAYLAEHPHSSAPEIHRGLAVDLPSLTQQSVHNIVQDLEQCGILRRISPPASNAALYEIADDESHHHVQCVICAEVVDVPASALGTPRLGQDRAEGMKVIGVEVTFLGVCARCESV